MDSADGEARGLRAKLRDPSLLKMDALIGREWLATRERFAVVDPATGQELAHVSSLSAAEAERAIAAAAAAWPAWRDRTAKARSQLLRRWFDLLIANQDDLALVLTSEQGKPLAEAKAEIAYAASFVEWFAEEAKRANGETLPHSDGDKRLLVIRQPIGVCAAITPWNFPLAMITRKVAPALAAGCPVVVKPAEATPLTALAAAELALRAGIPPGVLNVVTADSQGSIAVGRTLCASSTVRHLSFTGSTEVGRILYAQCAPTVKKLSLELGGNAPFVVFDDASLDSAVDGLVAAKFRNGGQTCVCANRVYVQDAVHDEFVQKLAAKVASLQVGRGTEPGVAIGPMIDAVAAEKVRMHVQDALAKGGEIVAGGADSGGNLMAPTVITGASQSMLVAQEETFGPLAAVFRFHTEAEVIAAANATDFGLAAYVYSRDAARIFRVAEALECGMVGINTGSISTEQAPFGGVKQSGLGREGSRHGIDEYVEMKYLCIGGMSSD